MSDEELIKTIKQFNVERVENLEDGAKDVFYAIMRIADERDELFEKVKVLTKQNEELYEKYTKLLKQKEL